MAKKTSRKAAARKPAAKRPRAKTPPAFEHRDCPAPTILTAVDLGVVMDPRQPANGRPRPLGFEAGSVVTPSPRIAKVLDDGQAAVDAAASDYEATLAALPLSVEQREILHAAGRILAGSCLMAAGHTSVRLRKEVQRWRSRVADEDDGWRELIAAIAAAPGKGPTERIRHVWANSNRPETFAVFRTLYYRKRREHGQA